MRESCHSSIRHGAPELRRIAAFALLLLFCGFPHAHLRGHDEIAFARALAAAGPTAFDSAAHHSGTPEHAPCSLCLTLGSVRGAMPKGAGPALPLLVAAADVALPATRGVPEAPPTAHTAPRAPPAA